PSPDSLWGPGKGPSGRAENSPPSLSGALPVLSYTNVRPTPAAVPIPRPRRRTDRRRGLMSQPQGSQPPSPSDETPARAELQHAAEMADLVAHEINNLLNNILLHVAVLERKAGEGVRAELNVIYQAGARAGALINRWQQVNPRRPPRLGPLDLNRATA